MKPKLIAQFFIDLVYRVFVWRKIKTYFHFISVIYAEMAQVVKIIPHGDTS